MLSDHVFMMLLGGFAAGIMFGIVPLLIAIKSNFQTLGYLLFSLCIIASLIFGMYGSIPASIISIGIIYIKKKKGVKNEPE